MISECRTLVVVLLLCALFAHAEYRSIDGSGNNQANPDWGQAGTPFVRIKVPQVAYDDGISEPRGNATKNLPNPRTISNELFVLRGTTDSYVTATDKSTMIAFFGQFLAHDITLASMNSSERCDIPVPVCDEYFDPLCSNTSVISQIRTMYAAGSSPRQQLNQASSYIDASHIYGHTQLRAATLRSLQGGKLRSTTNAVAGELLPRNTFGLPNDNPGRKPDTELFVAGDVRANENPLLTALHVIFLREHNRLCDVLAAANPTWGDEQLYQEARRLVIGIMQSITVNEYVPVLLGERLPAYTGYKANVNAGMENAMGASVFRYGHSEINSWLARLNQEGTIATHSGYLLRDVFYNPDAVSRGIDDLLLGPMLDRQGQVDTFLIDDMRNFLFGRPGFGGGHDLAALNINRGREHGIPAYNVLRQAYGLTPVSTVDQITDDPAMISALQNLYTSVADIDAYAGGLAEKHYTKESSLGSLFHVATKHMYTVLRDGDRFWYEGDTYTATEREFIESSTLSAVIQRNTGLRNLPRNAFLYHSSLTPESANAKGLDAAGADLRLTASVLQGRCTLRWAIDTSVLDMSVTCPTKGWVGIGFNPTDDGMQQADIVVGWVDDTTATAIVEDHVGKGYLTPPKDEVAGGRFSLLETAATQTATSTSIRFRRPLKANETTDQSVENGVNGIIVAFGITDDFVQHMATDREFVRIDLKTGDVLDSVDGRVIHGILMAIGWCLFVFPSAFLVRYHAMFLKDKKVATRRKRSTPRAVKWHMRMHAVGFAFVVAGIVVIALTLRVHLSRAHSVAGVVILVLCLAQPMRATQPSRAGPMQHNAPVVDRDRVHVINGWFTAIAGLSNIGVGMDTLGNVPAPLWALWVAYVFVPLVVALYDEVFRLRIKRRSHARVKRLPDKEDMRHVTVDWAAKQGGDGSKTHTQTSTGTGTQSDSPYKAPRKSTSDSSSFGGHPVDEHAQ